jgi:3-dehydroquinate synthetase/shikimate kinase
MRELLRPVVLLGPPGAGKTAVGRRAATVANLPFIDLDTVIAEREGRSVSQLMEDNSEVAFRVAELSALRAVLEDRAPALVSAGSGVVTTEQARAMLRRRARNVLIDVEPAEGLRRLADADATRPLLGADRDGWPERYAALEHTRRGAWESLCAERVDTTARSLEDAASALLAVLEVGDRPVMGGTGGLKLQGVTCVDDDPTRVLDAALAGAPAALVLDEGVPAGAGLAALLEAWGDRPIVRVPGGEDDKLLDSVGRLADALVEADLPPDGVVVGVGGGAVLDLVGFVASALYRGVRWLAVPTTLLAMVDASVGGKTAVNLGRGKNLLGSFWPPRSVLVDVRFLDSLGPRARRAGAAEMLKHAFLVADAPADGSAAPADEQIEAIAAGEADVDQTREAVRRSIAVKAGVVSVDPLERGLRRVLNLGHTFGHALEHEASLARQGRLLHGEAVAWGVLFSLELSESIAGLPTDVKETMAARVRALQLPPLPELPVGRLLDAMNVDKKRRRSGVAFVCLEAPGRPTIVRAPERAAVIACVEALVGGAS